MHHLSPGSSAQGSGTCCGTLSGGGSDGSVYIESESVDISDLSAAGGHCIGETGGSGRVYIDADAISGSSEPAYATP